MRKATSRFSVLVATLAVLANTAYTQESPVGIQKRLNKLFSSRRIVISNGRIQEFIRIGADDSKIFLRKKLGNVGTAYLALRYLGKFRDVDDVRIIAPFLSSKNEYIARRAANALADIGHHDAVPTLVKTLDPERSDLAATTIGALLRISSISHLGCCSEFASADGDR